MKYPEPTIRVNVDVTNPGQFFACCGLLELADRLWPGAEGWFESGAFHIATPGKSATLADLLGQAQSLCFDVGKDSDAKQDDSSDHETSKVVPIDLNWKCGTKALRLDWWTEKSIKPWAGSMNERVILRAMLDAIDPTNPSPFQDRRRVLYQPRELTKTGRPSKPKKKEPFYFDSRRGNKSHPLDGGFSPDTHNMESECCPALESLCFIGLQRARPASTETANRSIYTVWTKPCSDDPGLPVGIVGAVICGVVPWPSLGRYVFNNYFRTDRRQLKTFSQATILRSNHG